MNDINPLTVGPVAMIAEVLTDEEAAAIHLALALGNRNPMHVIGYAKIALLWKTDAAGGIHQDVLTVLQGVLGARVEEIAARRGITV